MANVDAFEDVSLETGDFEEFHYETQYVVLNYLGMVPPVLELGSQDGDESDGDKPDDEDYTTKSSAVGTEKSHQEDQRSPSTPDSQLLVGRLELEEPKMTSEEELVRSEIEESYLTHYNADESEAEQCGVSPSLESSAGSSNVSHGTPILIVEQYMESIQCYHRERLERRSNNTNLTTLVMPLREEVCHHLDTLDERRGCVSPRIWALSPSLDTQEPPPPPSPEAIIASRIAAIGDQIMLEHQNHTELNSAVKKLLGHNGTLDYNAFKEVAKDMIDTEEPSSGWHQIASVLNFSRHVALSLMRKGQRIGQLTEYSVKLIEENMANFIVDQGGWEAVSRINIEDYSSSDLS
uniref:Uncharacterized protein LOC102806775 n=1 Tax=Saccoglossus kowalevskii TaxID=10224 RepID=A0ABM0M552_SACKO|nr:PREDICTED: uncharacterized protein LOC102806775 [Saccoglossus kowalevskii]